MRWWWHHDNLLWLVFVFDGEPADLPPLPRDAHQIKQRTLHGKKTFSQDTYHLNAAGQIVVVKSDVGNPAKEGLRVTWEWNEPENIITRTVLDVGGPLLQTFTLWQGLKGRLSGVTLETMLEDGSPGDEAIYRVRQTKNKVWCDYGGEHQYTFNAAGFLTRWENHLRSLTFHYSPDGELTRIVGVNGIHSSPDQMTTSDYRYEAGLLHSVTHQGAEWGEFTETLTYLFDQAGLPLSCTMYDVLKTVKKWSYIRD